MENVKTNAKESIKENVIIRVKDLTIDFKVESGTLRACDHTSFDIYRNETIAIIGESGSGKSTLCSGILNMVNVPGRVSSGSVTYYSEYQHEEMDILKMKPQQETSFRWKEISTVFQAAQNALNPVLRIKEHFYETILAHEPDMKVEQMDEKIKKVLSYVRLDPAVMEYYPHHLSGGMKQRVLIAMSLVLDPQVIILDEPTTALDVVTQYYILQFLSNIQKGFKITMVFLTHDIAVVSTIADRIAVMYGGEIVEYGRTEDVLCHPTHPYTRGLVDAIPTLHDDVTQRRAIRGTPPDLTQDFTHCKFMERCPVYKEGKCEASYEKTRRMYQTGDDKFSRCYTWAEAAQAEQKKARAGQAGPEKGKGGE